MIEPGPLVAALSSALAIGLGVSWLAPPPLRLAGRVRPYVRGGRFIAGAGNAPAAGPVLLRLGRLALGPLARRLGRVVDKDGGARTRLRLRQAGLYPGLDDEQTLETYRIRQLEAGFVAVALAIAVAVAAQLSPARALGLSMLGLTVGLTRNRGSIDRAIRRRQELMRIEIYTVNQLLAMRVRAGGGVIQAVQQVVQRGTGEVVGELEEALRLHRAGMRTAAAFARLAELTPESSCARTYALLAAADERGADLAGALLALAEDVRESRREALRRAATRRRAAMLLPIIGILAPVMLLFVGAPLPRIIFNWQ
ncbi:MAG TPA: type II secretion system F family protein [Acidimicrobiia bacterium]|nr:type II secretion system F family protein [Acidimicrobiia bacterium]